MNPFRDCDQAPSGRCTVHGGWFLTFQDTGCQTLGILAEVRAERARQFEEYGSNEDLKDGTGGDWLAPVTSLGADRIEELLRQDYEDYEDSKQTITWMHLVREEVAEAFDETDPERLRKEVLQIAALCVSWVEKIDARPNNQN